MERSYFDFQIESYEISEGQNTDLVRQEREDCFIV